MGLSQESLKFIAFYKDKKRTGKKKNIHIYGVGQICVYKTEIAQRIFGSIQEYASFLNEDWAMSNYKKSKKREELFLASNAC